jgi:Protein of unknown function (DUF2971)
VVPRATSSALAGIVLGSPATGGVDAPSSRAATVCQCELIFSAPNMAAPTKDEVIDRLLAAGRKAVQSGMEAHRPPPVLYHFTSAEGAVGILKDKVLWASRAASLNDASEIRYGIDRTMNYLRQRLETEASPKRKVFLEHVLLWLTGGEGIKRERIINIDHFVASFCGRVDKSGLWLHYGRAGRGYALGFDTARLVRQPFELLKVIYDPQEQDALIDGAVRGIEEEFLNVVFEQDVDTFAGAGGVASHLCATNIRAMAARLKHPSFEAEDEWRLATMDLLGTGIEEKGMTLKSGYRATDGRIVPYMVAAFGADLPLTEIIVGYGVDLAAAQGALSFMFREEKIRPVPISKSDVPVR